WVRQGQHLCTVGFRSRNQTGLPHPFRASRIGSKLPRMTVTEALGSVKVVFMPAVTWDFLGGPSGSALPPSRLGCHWYWSLLNEITSTVPPKDRSESVAASWNMMCTGYDCPWSLLMTSRDH